MEKEYDENLVELHEKSDRLAEERKERDRVKTYSSFNAFVTSNTQSIYSATGSLEVGKYIKLFNTIIKVRLESGLTTKTDFKKKKVVLKAKKLTILNKKGLKYARENPLELKVVLETWLERNKK